MAMRNILTPSWFPPSRLFPMLLLVMLVILAACGIAPPPPDKTVYVVSETGTVYAVKGIDGSMRWRYQVGDAFMSNVVVLNNIAYAASPLEENIYALQTQDGASLWTYQAQSYFTGADPIVVDGVLYFSMNDGAIYALTSNDGAQIDRYDTPGRKLVTSSSLAVGP